MFFGFENVIHNSQEKISQLRNSQLKGVLKLIAPRLCGYCGGAIDSIISVITQLDRSGFNLEFETLFESI